MNQKEKKWLKNKEEYLRDIANCKELKGTSLALYLINFANEIDEKTN